MTAVEVVVSAERMRGAMRVRGLPEPDLAITKQALSGLSSKWHQRIGLHLAAITKASDDQDSLEILAWMAKLTQKALPVGELSAEAIDLLPDPGLAHAWFELLQPHRPAVDESTTLVGDSSPLPSASTVDPLWHGPAKVKVFGKKAGLTFELGRTRTSQTHPGGRHTVSIDAAPSLGDVYDWSHKIQLQLSPEELLQVLAVLMGYLGSFEAVGHGPEHNKRITVRPQTLPSPPGFLFMVAQGSRTLLVPATPETGMQIVALLLQSVLLQFPHLSSDTVLSMCRRIAALRGSP